eukprot:scaffold421247_cov37-Attheya_sp.AAC.3
MSRPNRQTLIQLGLAESQWLSSDAACLVDNEMLTQRTVEPTTDLWRNQNDLAIDSQRHAPIIRQSTDDGQPAAHRKQSPATLAKVTWNQQLITPQPRQQGQTTPMAKRSPAHLLPEHSVPVMFAGPLDAPSTQLATMCDHRLLLAIHQTGMDATVQSYTNLGIDPVVVFQPQITHNRAIYCISHLMGLN